MAHFAKIGMDNIVTDVLVVANRETTVSWIEFNEVTL
jgi:hypothetical protein